MLVKQTAFYLCLVALGVVGGLAMAIAAPMWAIRLVRK